MTTPDPILASVLQRRVQAISHEMATVLMRSSRSPIFNEVGDLVTVVFDRDGRTLAQTEYASIIANGAQPPLQQIIEYFAGEIHDGDVILHNDVYSGGNQNADVGVFVPIFWHDELVAWAASKGHVADIGGMTAGGYDPRAREIWQEAFRIPPLKLHDRGELRRDVWDLVRANIRLEIVAEDIKAMIGACTIGRRRIVDLLDRYGAESFDAHMDYVIEASERQVRAEIERWPDGVYRGESWMQSDGLDPTARYRVAVEVTVAGSDITFDFSATDDQAPGFTNMPAASAIGAIRIAFLMLVTAGGLSIPANHGVFAPIRTVFRKGSLIDPNFPASTIFGNQMCDEVVESIMLALADALPDRVTAGWNQFLCTALNGIDPRTDEPSVSLTIFQRGGPGAMRGADGYDALGFSGTPGSMRSPDMEMFELSTPHLMHYYEYLPDSAGHGEWRGGYGTRSSWTFQGVDEAGTTIGDDVASEGAERPHGLFGGGPGGLNELTLEYPDGRTKAWGSKEIVEGIPAGTVCVSRNGGGGGYGDARKRPAEQVLAEVRDGLLSAEAARRDYGVAIADDGRTIDEQTTRRLRQEERA
ncbi:hydantoinase B/oxoprolinase family protein [Patulibacter defluvii]|uniref:hydantoinase B/oxoprolinase family protein n=1 Tax=Patulibacter defluvii TaxID=3095358 RepID=UPI002A74C93B|nr:hydantoinase B/oxoprolinase family protein [Patulibacter sp. DM4]